MSLTVRKPLALLTIVGLAVEGMLAAAQPVSANIVRPAGATPISTSLVIAYLPCTAANPAGNQHNPANLPGQACTPPVQYTPRLTSGDPMVNGSGSNFRGNVKLSSTVGGTSGTNMSFNPGSPDKNYVLDVRCTPAYAAGSGAGVCSAPGSGNVLVGGGASPNPDYTGALYIGAWVRITDQANSGTACPPTCPNDATVQDLFFGVPADCAVLTANNVGAICLPRFSNANAMCSCIPTNRRMNMEVGVGNSSGGAATSAPTTGIFAMDGGNDGVVDPPGTAPTEFPAVDPDSPAPFAREGLFLP